MSTPLDRVKAALADRYAVVRELGAGGMATVYLATDLKHGRDVAIKVLRPELSASLGTERFHREIEIAARLHHPHILGLLAALFGLVALDSLLPTVFEIPVYLQPGWWRSEAGARELPWADLAPGWLKHAAVALVGSLGVGLLVKSRQLAGLLRRMLGRSLYSSAWDEFAVQNIGRWVLVTLSGGRVFYGVLGIASGDRKKDVVLYRPMPYDADKGTYQLTGN